MVIANVVGCKGGLLLIAIQVSSSALDVKPCGDKGGVPFEDIGILLKSKTYKKEIAFPI
ncbi:MAG TPA: hypothetical protein VHO70_15660 [Chitinispirillaceae bacterium]|nr:hypothetical protein [Chitinispirillaceae bacterium]